MLIGALGLACAPPDLRPDAVWRTGGVGSDGVAWVDEGATPAPAVRRAPRPPPVVRAPPGRVDLVLWPPGPDVDPARRSAAIDAALDAVQADWGLHALGRDPWPPRLRAVVDAATHAGLAHDPRIQRIEPAFALSPDGPAALPSADGRGLRDALGVSGLLTAGFDGRDTPVAIVDAGWFDADHPAWVDRRRGVWRWDWAAGAFAPLPADDELAFRENNHGSGVATQLLAGDDTAVGPAGGGFAPGAPWIYVHNEDTALGLELAVATGAEVINLSQSCASCPPCDTESWATDAVDLAYLAGAVVVSTPGNDGDRGRCNVHPPGTAAGSLTVNATRASGDVAAAPLTDFAMRGGDRHGRPLFELAAPGGREGPYQADYDDSWHEMGAGTSFAAPLVAGAAADLRGWIRDTWGPEPAADPGLTVAHLLLLADDETEAGAADPLHPAPDARWGYGRLHLDHLDPAAQTGAWADRWWLVPIHPDAPLALPLGPVAAGARRLEVVVWWFEPNVGPDDTPAQIDLQLCADTCVAGDGAPGTLRALVDDPGGQPWTILLDPIAIPPATPPGPVLGAQVRQLAVVALWR